MLLFALQWTLVLCGLYSVLIGEREVVAQWLNHWLRQWFQILGPPICHCRDSHLYKWDKYKSLYISAYHKCKCPHASYVIPGIGSKSLGELLIGYQSKFPFSLQCNLSNTLSVNSTTEHPEWPSTPFLISCFLVFTRLCSIFSSQLQCFKEKGARVRTIAHVCFYLDSRNLLEPGVTNNWMASVCLF